MSDPIAFYQKIKELAPSLADLTISIIPGDIPFNYQPSLRTDMIMPAIYDLPRQNVNPVYATHFLDFNGIMSTDYILNALGYCFYKTGQQEQALQALAASLRLNPKPGGIKKLVAEVKKD